MILRHIQTIETGDGTDPLLCSLHFSITGERLFAGGNCWSVQTGHRLWSVPCTGPSSLTVDGTVYLTIGAPEGSPLLLHKWDATDGAIQETIPLPILRSRLAAFSAFAPILLLLDGEPGAFRVLIVNPTTGQVTRVLPIPQVRIIDAMTFFPNGETFLMTEYDTAAVWDLVTGKMLHRMRIAAGTDQIAIAPDSLHLAMCWGWTGNGNTAALIDAHTGKITTRLTTEVINSLTFSPDSTLLLGGGGSTNDYFRAEIQLWDVDSGTLLNTTRSERATTYDYIRSVAFSTDTRMVAGFGDSGSIYVWQLY